MFDKLCANCDVCRFMPEQRYQRILIHRQEKPTKILVVDDHTGAPYVRGKDMASFLLGDEPFEYTTTVRCHYERGEISFEQESEALARCSVWTKNVVGSHAIHLCTKRALEQLGIGKERVPGDVFSNSRLGLVLCIEPLATIDAPTVASYTTKIERLFKKAGIK